jgi:hypothetical protein
LKRFYSAAQNTDPSGQKHLLQTDSRYFAGQISVIDSNDTAPQQKMPANAVIHRRTLKPAL